MIWKNEVSESFAAPFQLIDTRFHVAWRVWLAEISVDNHHGNIGRATKRVPRNATSIPGNLVNSRKFNRKFNCRVFE